MYAKEGICVVKRKDKCDVLTISSKFPHSMREINAIREVKENRKSLRWYKKIGFHFLHSLLINSYFLYNKHVKKCHYTTTDYLLYKNYYQVMKIFKRLLIKLKNPVPFICRKKFWKLNKRGIFTKYVKSVMIKGFVMIQFITVDNVVASPGYVWKNVLKSIINKF